MLHRLIEADVLKAAWRARRHRSGQEVDEAVVALLPFAAAGHAVGHLAGPQHPFLGGSDRNADDDAETTPVALVDSVGSAAKRRQSEDLGIDGARPDLPCRT